MYYLLLICLVAVGVIDWKYKIIPNKLLLFMFITALVYQALANGYKGLLTSLLIALIYYVIGAIIFMLGGMGGGDVKLMAVLGAWLGLVATYWVILIASVIGAVVGIYKYIRMGILKERMQRLWGAIYLKIIMRTKGDVGFERLSSDITAEAPPTAIPFGMCLALAVIIVEVQALYTSVKFFIPK